VWSAHSGTVTNKVMVPDVQRMKAAGERITMVTAYDRPFARLKEGGAEAVKLEGGLAMARIIEAIAAIDVPVVGHVGPTPQSVHRMGGHRVPGPRSGHGPGERERVLGDARAGQAAGAFALVLEWIPLDLAAEITAELTIPTISIGAGAHCDGQVLVMHDLLGLSTDWTPRFAKRYAELGREVVRAAGEYLAEVKRGRFPTEAQAFAPRAARAG